LKTADFFNSHSVFSLNEADSGNEAKYISSIHHGEVYPELLFMDDSKEGKRVSLHPTMLWKLINVRNHLARAQTKTKSKF
jgi:hypothetical protein